MKVWSVLKRTQVEIYLQIFASINWLTVSLSNIYTLILCKRLDWENFLYMNTNCVCGRYLKPSISTHPKPRVFNQDKKYEKPHTVLWINRNTWFNCLHSAKMFSVIHSRNEKISMQKEPANRTENVVLHPNELLELKNSFFIK